MVTSATSSLDGVALSFEDDESGLSLTLFAPLFAHSGKSKLFQNLASRHDPSRQFAKANSVKIQIAINAKEKYRP